MACVRSADCVSVDVRSDVIFDNVCVRMDSVISSVRVNVEDSTMVNVPYVSLTE